jgi:hypothetical protein
MSPRTSTYDRLAGMTIDESKYIIGVHGEFREQPEAEWV